MLRTFVIVLFSGFVLQGIRLLSSYGRIYFKTALGFVLSSLLFLQLHHDGRSIHGWVLKPDVATIS